MWVPVLVVAVFSGFAGYVSKDVGMPTRVLGLMTALYLVSSTVGLVGVVFFGMAGGLPVPKLITIGSASIVGAWMRVARPHVRLG